MENQFYIQERMVARSTVRFMAVEHHPGGFERHWTTIAREIGAADTVIPEYFPIEFAYSKDRLVRAAAAHYAPEQKLFYELVHSGLLEPKRVITLDPYFDRVGVNARMSGYAACAALGVAVGYRFGNELQSLVPISRRTLLEKIGRGFLKGGGFFFTTVMAGSFGIHELDRREAGHRRTTVAERLWTLMYGKDAPPHALVIYPPAHVEGIVASLDDHISKGKQPGHHHSGRIYTYLGDPPGWSKQP